MKKIIIKSFSLIAIQAIYQISTFVNKVLLTRLLSVSDFGVLSIILLWTNLISQLLEFGTSKLVTKEIAKNKSSSNNSEVQAITTWSLLLILLLTALLLVLAIKKNWISGLISVPPEYIYILILIAFSIAIYQWHFAIYNGFGKVSNGRLIQFIFVPIALLLFLLHSQFTGSTTLKNIVSGFTIIYAIGALIAIGLSLKISRINIVPWKLTQTKTRNWLSFSFLNFLIVFLQIFYSRLDLIFVNLFLSTKDFALYSIAASIIGTLSFVNIAFVLSLESKISYFHSKGQIRKLLPFLRRNMITQTLFVIFIYLIVLLIGERILELFGAEYAEISLVLNILCLALIIQSTTASSGSLLIMGGYLKERTLSTLIPTIVAIVFYPIAIQQYGLTGVAIGYLLLLVIHRGMMMFYVNRKMGFKFFYLG